jgi:hypothetical protein
MAAYGRFDFDFGDGRTQQSDFARLEARMERIEGTLKMILDRLPASELDANDGTKKRKLDKASWASQANNPSDEQKQEDEEQHPGQKLNMAHFENRQYTYSSLDSRQCQIRLLTVHRGAKFTNPLVANLDVYNLDRNGINSAPFGGGLFGSNSHNYAALSYAWGPKVYDGLIIIDGCWFPITKSLEAALRQLRSGQPHGISSGNRFWIDQICINQADKDERSSQVNRMRLIYQNASSVQVWLGEEADESALAINVLKRLAEPSREGPGQLPVRYPKHTEEEIMHHWDALRALFKRQWWRRVWIRQEFALNNSMKLLCGSESFDVNELKQALSMLSYISSFGYTSSFSCSDDESTVTLPWDYHARKLVELRDLVSQPPDWVGLAQLLCIIRACESREPNDMVFSVLGLANPKCYPIAPDYRQDFKRTLLTATKLALDQPCGLELLGSCQNPERYSGFPSWIPLLNEKWRAMPFPSMSAGKSALFSTKSKSLTKAERPEIRVEGEVLNLQGGLVDKINSICNIFVRNNSNADELESVYKSWKKFAEDKPTLCNNDRQRYVLGVEPEKSANWIRFLTVLKEVTVTFRNAANSSFGTGLFGSGGFQNLKVARAYLLPSSHVSAEPHPNHKINNGLQMYGVGRRLGVTSGGFLALLPAQAHKGDVIALFQGATFPYVLRRVNNSHGFILVGEAFIPTWATEIGEVDVEAACRKSNIDLKSWIQIL